MSFTRFFDRIIGSLESAGIPYMLTGSLAGSYHGVPRATQDVDLVVELLASDVDALCAEYLSAGFYVSADAAREAIDHAGQFNVIDPDSGWKADLIVRKPRSFSRAEFERREQVLILDHSVWIASAEDLVIAKLEWARMGESERQLSDVAGILRFQGARIDLGYLESWISELGLDAAWESVQADAGEGCGS